MLRVAYQPNQREKAVKIFRVTHRWHLGQKRRDFGQLCLNYFKFCWSIYIGNHRRKGSGRYCLELLPFVVDILLQLRESLWRLSLRQVRPQVILNGEGDVHVGST
jgi:hypothetical protein